MELSAPSRAEDNAGSNAHCIATWADRRGDGDVGNHQTVFITGMDRADWVMVVARTGDDESTGRGRVCPMRS